MDNVYLYKELSLCDEHYLSARLNFMCGLLMPGVMEAAKALEKIMKGLLFIKGKTQKELKKMNHFHVKIAEETSKKYSIHFTEKDYAFFKELEQGYRTDYAENWEENQGWNLILRETDHHYIRLHNLFVQNFPDKSFLGEKHRPIFLDSAYNGQRFLPELKNKFDSMSWEKILKTENKSIEQLIKLDDVLKKELIEK